MERNQEIKDFPINRSVSIIDQGGLMGEADVFCRDHYTSTSKCYSERGKLFRLHKEVFNNLKSTNSNWMNILLNTAFKEVRAEGLDLVESSQKVIQDRMREFASLKDKKKDNLPADSSIMDIIERGTFRKKTVFMYEQNLDPRTIK